MEYRALGKTGDKVSCIGLGGGPLGSCDTEYGVEMVRRALELGVTYFDTARSYWDSEIKIGMGLQGHRDEVFVSSKTGEVTRDGAWRHIYESLERLRTDYLDNYHLHSLRDEDDLRTRLGPGGALEALVEAREQGIIRHIGCTCHSSRSLLVKALNMFDFEIILVPMNIAEREPLDELIPLCLEKGVGVTIMKPLATGLIPADLALKWLLNQPIATTVPGASTLEEVTENSWVGHLKDVSLSEEERARVDGYADILSNLRCRICYKCEPCPAGISIATTLGTDVIYDHYRTMGPETFAAFPWSEERISHHIADRRIQMERIEACDECGRCEENCPYGLPVIRMLKGMLPSMEDILRIWEERLSA